MNKTVVEAKKLHKVTKAYFSPFRYRVTNKNIRTVMNELLQHGHSLIYNPGLEKVLMPLKIPIIQDTCT